MTITASPCIKDSCLMVRGKVFFTQVPQNVVVSPASSDSSAFIGATSTTQSSRHVFNLGFLEFNLYCINSNASPGSNSAREDFTLHDAAAENTFYILLLPVLEGVMENWIIELSECIIKIKGKGCGRFVCKLLAICEV
ncbi:hypothetical protein EZV62_008233 [Acer yangbiense]|uniref:Uncharacterized protein n=1 Tax=Acer yangbiense TaxID=1000413 RepID=A0A5C7ID45_9ROSI|nr:hypothetical protein EZV62_008233 [Acer yangbiense]